MTEAEFPLWTARERRCFKKAVALGSPEATVGSPEVTVIFLPSSFKNDNPLGPQAPSVSIAIGTKWWAAVSVTYFVSLTPSADFAAYQPLPLTSEHAREPKFLGLWRP